MHVAVLDRPGSITVAERAAPAPGPGDVLVRVRAVGICGSDVHYYQHGRLGRYVVQRPLILGHEPAGEVVDVGDRVPPSRIGEYVAIEPGIPCRRCEYCKGGRYNLCADVVFLATPPVDGAFVEYLVVPADFAHRLPTGLSFAAAALVEPTAVAVHAARLAHVQPGEQCLVFGAGPVGLLLAQVLRGFGAGAVTIVDPAASRRALAQHLGATAAAPESVSDLPLADAVFDASGSPRALAASIDAVRRGGRIAWIGLPVDDQVPIPAATLIDKEVELHGVFRYANAHRRAIDLVASGSVQTLPLVSHRFPLDRAGEALALAASRADDVLKIIVEP